MSYRYPEISLLLFLNSPLAIKRQKEIKRESQDFGSMNNAIHPKRVAGGIVLGGKKKKKKRKVVSTAETTTGDRSSSVPSILKSVPPHEEVDSASLPKAAAVDYDDDGFEELLSANDDEIPTDTLICLQSYTQAPTSGGGMISESCAYCPIFDSNNNNNKSCTHAAPFLTKDVLLHILDAKDSTACSSTSRMQTEKEIKDLAARNKIKLMQLHGTSIATFTKTNTASSTAVASSSKEDSMKFSNSGVTGLRGDGNDDDDIAIMEIGAYETAVKMALLQCHSSTLSHEEQQTFNVDIISDWFLNQLVPYFAGKTWISSSALHSFIQTYRVKEYWSVEGMERIIHELTMAGLFLPRRGLGGSGGMDGYWFYLPGMGNASKSIANGRVVMLRKLKSCKYQEKKRTILESEHGVFKDGSSSSISDALDNSWGSAKKKKVAIQQSGKFLVLDLLARGLVILKQTSSGEHFIGLPK